MPSSIQVVIQMIDANNYMVGSVNDSFATQFGRHHTGTIGSSGAYWTFLWPTTGETLLYMKFLQQLSSYTVSIIHDVASPSPLFFTVPAGTGFTPVILPEPPASAAGPIYYAIETSAIIPVLPMYFF